MEAKETKSKGNAPVVRGARKVRLQELPIFTRQVSAMLSAGMPLVQTLIAMESQTDNKTSSRSLPVSGPALRAEQCIQKPLPPTRPSLTTSM